MPITGRREHIIKVAIGLFCEHGFHATGVDMIMREAKVSKKTMYNHFRSKDELILAALRQYDSLFRNNFVKQLEEIANTPKEKLLAIFDVCDKWFNSQNFFGCMFINVVGEYSSPDSPFRDISKQFKSLMKSYILNWAEEAGADDPQLLASEIGILLEGAIVTAQVSQDPNAAKNAKAMAEVMIQNRIGI
ncbi:MAG: TetR/AcrR family transcriptional regulator [Lentisphaeraceae bacterium]|nr:TetR/AcrR family transcriptional regulator [Lentisphaeraceae bacterium]